MARLLAPNYTAHFADADPGARPHGVAPDRWHVIPLASDPEFVPRLAALCAALDVDLLIPGVDEELLSLAQASMPCAVLLPPAPFVATHLDKLDSMRDLERYVAVPRTERADRQRWVGYPCVVKPRHGRGSRGVAVVRSDWERDAHFRPSCLPDSAFVVQEKLEGQEYTVTVAADRAGRLRAVVPVRVELKRGITIRARTHHDPDVVRMCERIHAANPVPGVYNVQCIKTASGVFPFEVNPRVSTTLCLAIAAGADVIGAYLATGYEPLPLKFRDGVELRRSWHNEFREAA